MRRVLGWEWRQYERCRSAVHDNHTNILGGLTYRTLCREGVTQWCPSVSLWMNVIGIQKKDTVPLKVTYINTHGSDYWDKDLLLSYRPLFPLVKWWLHLVVFLHNLSSFYVPSPMAEVIINKYILMFLPQPNDQGWCSWDAGEISSSGSLRPPHPVTNIAQLRRYYSCFYDLKRIAIYLILKITLQIFKQH